MKTFVYRGTIKVSRDDFQAAVEGQKKCTIRLGTAAVEGPEINLSDGARTARVRIVNIDTSKTFAGLTDAEIGGEGFTTREELETDLRKYYRSLQPDQRVTVIWFEVL
jgi:hypothetical protein